MSICDTGRNSKQYHFWGDFHMAKRHQNKFNSTEALTKVKTIILSFLQDQNNYEESKLLHSGAVHEHQYLQQPCLLTPGFFTSNHAIFPVRLIH